MIKRRRTRQIKVGDVRIGGNAPVSVQSMAKADTSDVKAVVSGIRRLESAGCEMVRVAVKSFDDALAIRRIKRGIRIPLVADIHFNYRLALEAIKSGADKVRLNPGNIGGREGVGAVIKAAKKARVPVRIGVNSGSSDGEDPVKLASRYIELFEKNGFYDIIISLKASDVMQTIEAYRRMSKACDYPLHLGVTASGPYDSGVIKSAIGIGALLADGIGDTIRVSLTADPVEEVIAARRILSALKLREFGPDIIFCPTCGRCQVDLGAIVKELESKISAIRHPPNAGTGFTIAVMGCEVNGPGEAKEADIGIAFGKDSGMLFRSGKAFKKVAAKNAVDELIKLLITHY